MLPRRYRRGMAVFFQGEPVDALYVIEMGAVKASVVDPGGQEHILHVLGPGDFFPHVGLLDGGPAPGTAQAMEETAVWAIRREDFFRILAETPAMAVRMVAVLGRQIRRLQGLIQEMAAANVPARLARALLRLAEEHGEPPEQARRAAGAGPGTVRVTVQLSRQELASLVGTTRETVSRVLAAFRREGLVTTEGGRLLLPDVERLRQWASSGGRADIPY